MQIYRYYFLIVFFFLSTSKAALLDLADKPLFLGQSVPPNIFFSIDDSGSMDWDIMMSKYYHFCAYNNNAPGAEGSNDCYGNGIVTSGAWRTNISQSGNYLDFYYLFDAPDNVYYSACSSFYRASIEACVDSYNPVTNPSYDKKSLLTSDWRVLSSDLNTTYYDPDVTYTSWVLGACFNNGNSCQQATFTAARSDPKEGSDGFYNFYDLSQDTNSTFNSEYFPATYHVWSDTAGFNESDGRPRRGTNINYILGANGIVDLWDENTKIIIKSNNVTVTKYTYSPDTSDINEQQISYVIPFTDSNENTICYNALGSKNLVKQIQNGTFAYDSVDGEGCRTLKAAKDNFANWFQYHRRRAFIAKSATSTIINNKPSYHYGLNTINDYLFIEVPVSTATDVTTHNINLLNSLFNLNWQALGTPLRRGLEKAGKYFDGQLSGVDDPIGSSCQLNFTIMLTDGYWSGSNPSSFIGNADGDNYSYTLADVAKYYYDKDLSPLPNELVPSNLDPATHQHMVTFGVAFGVDGNLQDTNSDGWPNPPLIESSDWGNPYYSNAAKIDDLWHAAYNSKGGFISASTPSQVVSALNNALDNIANRVGSAASVAANSSFITADTSIYQGLFNSDNWSGQLLSFAINNDGSIENMPRWNAGCLLTGGTCQNPYGQNAGKSYNQRVIFTKGRGGYGIPFRAPSNYRSPSLSELGTEQLQNLMINAPYDYYTTAFSKIIKNQSYLQNLINYLRGDKTNEAAQIGNTSGFRNRDSILGDIINSAPVYVGAPNFNFQDNLETSPYSSFKSTYQNRTSMVYVGANDGMLHGFSADTGEELMAYIPAVTKIYENLPTLSFTEENHAGSKYTHKYFVDGTVTSMDVFINNAWRTVLIGGLNAGGQGIYALDVTSPANFTENNAANLLLWEFTDEDDSDLGYSFSKPQITKVRYDNLGNTKWAAIVGNGYNNTESDGNASSTGQAALFIVFIERGADGQWTTDNDYIKIPVGTGSLTTPNGLGTPVAISTDGDIVTDYVYAGDLQGNLWKFDLTSTNPISWKDNANKIFTAVSKEGNAQPIVTKPAVAKHPSKGGIGIIYFGTGKYIENSDNSAVNQPTQTLYAVWDDNSGAVRTRANLQEQEILAELSELIDTNGDGNFDSSQEVRVVSNNQVNWNNEYGWYMDLIVSGSNDNRGEKVLAAPFIRNGRVIFTTILPSGEICQFGGDSWLMELDFLNGSFLNTSPFDINQDGKIDEQDQITYQDNNSNTVSVPAGGIKSKVGITQKPTVIMSEDKKEEYKLLSGSAGINSISESVDSTKLGRQNWRQFFR